VPRARLAAAALLVAASVGVYLGWSSGWLQRLDPTRRSVVVLGDSITTGDGVSPEVTFPRRLAAALGVPAGAPRPVVGHGAEEIGRGITDQRA